MKKYILILIGILTSISLSAQTAEEYLNSVIEKHKSYDDISIIFNCKVVDTENGYHESTTGHASMKGDSYIMNIEGQEMICNGETLWTHLIYDEEVMISEVTEDNDSSPLGIINSFSENVTATFIETDDPDIKVIEIKEIIDATFEKILLSFNKHNSNIKKIHIFISEGNEFIYEITDFKTNQNLPDSMFIFDETIHPNVEVIDMR